MKRWHVVAVLALFIAVNACGFAAVKANNGLTDLMEWGSWAGSEINDTMYVSLNSVNGIYYRCELSSMDGHRFDALFVNYTDMVDARTSGKPIDFDPDRSALNVTRVTMEGRLPDGSSAYVLLILSAEPGAGFAVDSRGDQGPFPPSLEPVFQAANFICTISSISLLLLLVFTYDRYRSERRPGC